MPKAAKASKVCEFCQFGTEVRVCGRLWTCSQPGISVTAHHKCMQYSAGLVQYKDNFTDFGNFDPKEVKKEVKRGNKLKCHICKNRHGSATAGCALQICPHSFHFLCAKQDPNRTTLVKKINVYQGEGDGVLDEYVIFCKESHKSAFDKKREEAYKYVESSDEELPWLGFGSATTSQINRKPGPSSSKKCPHETPGKRHKRKRPNSHGSPHSHPSSSPSPSPSSSSSYKSDESTKSKLDMVIERTLSGGNELKIILKKCNVKSAGSACMDAKSESSSSKSKKEEEPKSTEEDDKEEEESKGDEKVDDAEDEEDQTVKKEEQLKQEKEEMNTSENKQADHKKTDEVPIKDEVASETQYKVVGPAFKDDKDGEGKPKEGDTKLKEGDVKTKSEGSAPQAFEGCSKQEPGNSTPRKRPNEDRAPESSGPKVPKKSPNPVYHPVQQPKPPKSKQFRRHPYFTQTDGHVDPKPANLPAPLQEVVQKVWQSMQMEVPAGDTNKSPAAPESAMPPKFHNFNPTTSTVATQRVIGTLTPANDVSAPHMNQGSTPNLIKQETEDIKEPIGKIGKFSPSQPRYFSNMDTVYTQEVYSQEIPLQPRKSNMLKMESVFTTDSQSSQFTQTVIKSEPPEMSSSPSRNGFGTPSCKPPDVHHPKSPRVLNRSPIVNRSPQITLHSPQPMNSLLPPSMAKADTIPLVEQHQELAPVSLCLPLLENDTLLDPQLSGPPGVLTNKMDGQPNIIDPSDIRIQSITPVSRKTASLVDNMTMPNYNSSQSQSLLSPSMPYLSSQSTQELENSQPCMPSLQTYTQNSVSQANGNSPLKKQQVNFSGGMHPMKKGSLMPPSLDKKPSSFGYIGDSQNSMPLLHKQQSPIVSKPSPDQKKNDLARQLHSVMSSSPNNERSMSPLKKPFDPNSASNSPTPKKSPPHHSSTRSDAVLCMVNLNGIERANLDFIYSSALKVFGVKRHQVLMKFMPSYLNTKGSNREKVKFDGLLHLKELAESLLNNDLGMVQKLALDQNMQVYYDQHKTFSFDKYPSLLDIVKAILQEADLKYNSYYPIARMLCLEKDTNAVALMLHLNENTDPGFKVRAVYNNIFIWNPNTQVNSGREQCDPEREYATIQSWLDKQITQGIAPFFKPSDSILLHKDDQSVIKRLKEKVLQDQASPVPENARKVYFIGPMDEAIIPKTSTYLKKCIPRIVEQLETECSTILCVIAIDSSIRSIKDVCAPLPNFDMNILTVFDPSEFSPSCFVLKIARRRK